jgi:hypothetical protein
MVVGRSSFGARVPFVVAGPLWMWSYVSYNRGSCFAMDRPGLDSASQLGAWTMSYEELRNLARSFGFDVLFDPSHSDLPITDVCVREEAMGRPPDRASNPQSWQDWGNHFWRMLLDVGGYPAKPCMCSRCTESFSVTAPAGKGRLHVTIGPRSSIRF